MWSLQVCPTCVYLTARHNVWGAGLLQTKAWRDAQHLPSVDCPVFAYPQLICHISFPARLLTSRPSDHNGSHQTGFDALLVSNPAGILMGKIWGSFCRQVQADYLAGGDRNEVDLAGGGAHSYDGCHHQLIGCPSTALACKQTHSLKGKESDVPFGLN